MNWRGQHGGRLAIELTGFARDMYHPPLVNGVSSAICTKMKNRKEPCLPSREVCYAYTAGMHLGQQLELNLRAVLYVANYHGWGEPIELEEHQMKRFKDTDAFIDKATCGLIIEKLRGTNTVKGASAWKTFARACEHRNELAHSFLLEQDFCDMTKQQESEIVQRLHRMISELYEALRISDAIRKQAEHLADADHEITRKLFARFGGANDENPDRHYSTRRRNKQS